MTEKIIEADGLTKRFGSLEVVKGIHFYVKKGSLFAFLGPNGAGKSTTINILSTQITADSGTASLNGYTLGRQDTEIRRSLGIVFQESVLDKRLTVLENADLRAGFYGMNRSQRRQAARTAVAAVGAESFAARRYGQLSGGQKRRADIVRALVHTPDILFLDEPTTGLDPASRAQVWETVNQLRQKRGITVFLTTHYMEEAARADYVVVLDKGTIIAEGTPSQLREKYSQDALLLTGRDPEVLRARLEEDHLDPVYSGGQFRLPLRSTLEAIPLLERYKDMLSSVEIRKGSMDQVFLNLIGEEEGEDGRPYDPQS